MNLLTGHKSYKNEPGGTRTPDTRFRKPLLYPTELLVLGIKVPAFIILHLIEKCKDFFQKVSCIQFAIKTAILML